MNTLARGRVATQGLSRASAATEAERKTNVMGPDDARSDSHKVICLARKVAGKHSALLEKLAQK